MMNDMGKTTHPAQYGFAYCALRGLVRITFVICIFALQAVGAQGKAYTEIDIRTNVLNYLNVVLGQNLPTLHDYLHSEGAHNPAEYDLESIECDARWGAKNQGYGDADPAALCIAWKTERGRNAKRVPSLYLLALRRSIAADPGTIVIRSIVPSTSEALGGGVRIEVELEKKGGGPRRIELRHARNDIEADIIGLVSVRRIDDAPVQQALGNL